MNPRLIEQQIQKNELAIENAKRVEEHLNWTIRDSKRRRDRALAALRRAGYLRDV
ncbi:MAG TPA: hypothetical protein VFX35_10770 [Solirubrobacterales bacterium]|nr:hypothetical protein [Solirubrobacterales bacterium]